MRIHKFTHSCFYVENEDASLLFDPGSYTAREKSLDLENIKRLDYILITHQHPDHMDIDLIKKITGKFPDLKILTNPSVKTLLGEEGVEAQTEEEKEFSFGKAQHEKVFGPDVENWTMTVGDKVFNPGDSYRFNNTKEILILPIQSPWGHMVEAVEKAIEVKPRYVIPAHDWHWREEAREALYEQAFHELKKHDIIFVKDIHERPFEYR